MAKEFKRVTQGLLTRIAAAKATDDDDTNKQTLIGLFCVRSPVNLHLKNFLAYRVSAFGHNMHWIEHSKKKKMSATTLKKHLEAARAAVEMDIAAFHEDMLATGKLMAEDLKDIVEGTYEKGIDNATKAELETILMNEHAKAMEEIYKINMRAIELKRLQTECLPKLVELRDYLMHEPI
jgi:hypothetical protein